MEILSCKELKFTYNGAAKPTLTNVSFSVLQGDVVLLAGLTGSGKSTLLRLLKKEIAPVGNLEGEITVKGELQSSTSLQKSALTLSYVSQNPDTQTVTHKVSSELAFGLENLGADPAEITSRVGEMASYFGIEDIYNKDIDTLSGGEKQLCNLCAAAVTAPEILLLDEPAAQLDPIGTHKLFSALRRLNSELGTTIIIAEHEPGEIFEICTKVVFLRDGESTCYTSKEDFAKAAYENISLLGYLPTAVRVTAPLGETAFTVKDAKSILSARFPAAPSKEQPKKDKKIKDPAFKVSNVYFRYSREDRDVISELDLTLNKGEIFAALGSNGCGKTTMLKVLSGILRPWQGKLRLDGKALRAFKGNTLYRRNIALMPQNPYDLFTRPTVAQCLKKVCDDMGTNEGFEELCSRFEITGLLEMHPYDLSGGEIQKCAMVKLLLTQPKMLFLDEPSKGLDPSAKQAVGEVLTELSNQGTTICIATHDIEFAAKYAHRCGLFFSGRLHSISGVKEFFSHNRFYTTDASRIARDVFPHAVTCSELEKSIDESSGR